MPRGKAVTAQEMEKAIREYWPMGSYHSTSLFHSTFFYALKAHRTLFLKVKAEFAARALNLTLPPVLDDLERSLQMIGPQGAMALLVIHHLKLFKKTAKSFKAYCKKQLRLSRFAALRRIDYAEVYMEMLAFGNESKAKTGFLASLKEGHVRVLRKVPTAKDRYHLFEKLALTGKPITARALEKELRKTRSSLTPTRPPKQERFCEALVSIQLAIEEALAILPDVTAAKVLLERAQAAARAALASA